MLDRLVAIIAPHECIGCQTEGSLLCSACQNQVLVLPERCYKCYALSPEGRTCDRCRKTSALTSVQAATNYDGWGKELVWRLKFAQARAAVQPMADLMVSRLLFDGDTLLVPVPTATGRVRQRGYDQAEILCRELSNRARLPYRRLLARHGQSRQVGTSRDERLRHLSSAFRVLSARQVTGRRIVLVDDVLTTGATLETAARALKKAGAKQVEAIVFAQA